MSLSLPLLFVEAEKTTKGTVLYLPNIRQAKDHRIDQEPSRFRSELYRSLDYFSQEVVLETERRRYK